MIAPTLSIKLEGRYYEAFRSFALRSGANTSTENLKRLIETLPEYKNLLNIHENANPLREVQDSTTNGIEKQANNPN